MDGERHRSRRRALLRALAASASLAACGGGGDAGPPAIAEFSADRSSAFVGERVTLTARFSGGSGRIEPGIGKVTAGVPVTTAPLAATTTFTLTVDNGLGRVSRTLEMPVAYRNRYRALAQPFVVARHAVAALADGTVLAIGGSRGGSTLSESIDRYDAENERFVRIGALASGRESHSATVLADGRVLVAGGLIALNGFSAAELIDARTGSVQPTGAPKRPRHGHTATRLADGRVLLTGGWGPGGDVVGLLANAELWDPASGEFRLLAATMANSRGGHTATVLGDGRVLIAGGFSGSPAYRYAELFDPSTERFTPVTGGPSEPRALHAAFRLADGSVLLAGGENDTGTAVSSVLRYDPARQAIETAAPLSAPRTLVAGALAADDRVLLFGGADADLSASARAEAYRAGSGAVPLAPLPQPRAWHSVTRLADGRMLVLGGEDRARAYVPTVVLYE